MAPANSHAPDPDPLEVALAYHQRTKHHFERYATGPPFMDWNTQPDPFRRFIDAPLLKLPPPEKESGPTYDQLFDPGSVPARPLSLNILSSFLYHSLALSAWKQFGEARWSLRVNPSSGNLHPTEGYLILPALEAGSIASGIYHYASREHALEHRCTIGPKTWRDLAGDLPGNSFLVGLTSIHWRESWKYGERAYRYCQHDAGHALGALRFAAALLGWRVSLLNAVPDEQIQRLLGLDHVEGVPPAEQEAPDMLMAVMTSSSKPPPDPKTPIRKGAIDVISQSSWLGKANRLSLGHHAWPVIDQVAAACHKPLDAALPPPPRTCETGRLPTWPDRNLSASRIIRQRRSAVDMDGQTGMGQETFFRMLSRVVPDAQAAPWDTLNWAGHVHLGLFVHRVEGLVPGLYALARNHASLESLQSAMKPGFTWKSPPAAPKGLPFFLLEERDVRQLSAQVSCHQGIAGQGAFSLGMLAEFEPLLKRYGAHAYRHLFWETGLIGQVLYLEAEAAGLRATGIGCFFDDPVHALFGLRNREFQSLYHFTVGGPVEDPRLTTWPAYDWDAS